MEPNRRADWVDRLSKSVQQHESSRRLTLGTIPRYEFLQRLGKGGMGVVYRAMDRVLSREVALKVLIDPIGAPAEARGRFLQEARLAATLQHPNIVPIFDAGEHEGQVFLAMQLIDGSGLERSTMALREAVTAVRDAARAVHYAHERGIIHRDLKPSNVMVDRTGRVFVTDFGLARRSDSAARMTLTGTIVGTPIYMPPEQARGTETDARSDVYSLGATLYELASGRPPFSGVNELEILKHVLLDEPPFPRKHAPSLPQDLESVILKAMDKKPPGRYATAAALADDLDRWLRAEPVQAPVRGAFYRVRKKIVRHRWRVLATAATIGFVVSSAAFAWPYVRAHRAYSAASEVKDRGEKRRLLELAAPYLGRAHDALSKLVAGEELEEQRRRAIEAEIARKAKEKDERIRAEREDRLKTINAVIAGFHTDVDQQNFLAAEKKLTQLRGLEAERLDDLHARIRKAEFDAEFARLMEQAERVDPEAFQETYTKLSGERFQAQADRDSKLGKAALDLASRVDEKLSGQRLTWLDRAAERRNESPRLFELRGLVHLKLGNFEKATKDYLQLKALGSPIPSGYAQLFVELASAAREGQRWAEAWRHLDTALQISPNYPRAIYQRSILRCRTGPARAGLIDFDGLPKGDPEFKPAREHLDAAENELKEVAARTWAIKDPAAARKERTTIVELTSSVLESVSGEPAGPLLELAKMRRRLGQFQKAAEDAGRAPDSFESFLIRSQILYSWGTTEPKALPEALRNIEKALEAARGEKKIAQSWYWRGLIRHALGLADAMGDLREAERRGQKGPDLCLRLARASFADKDDPRAIEFAARALQNTDPGEEEYVATLAEAAGSSVEQASRQLKIGALYIRARGSYRQASYKACQQDCSAVLELDPAHRDARYHRGLASQELLQYDAAIADFTKLIEVDSADADAYAARGTCRFRTQDSAGGTKDYEEALRVGPKNWEDRSKISERLKKR